MALGTTEAFALDFLGSAVRISTAEPTLDGTGAGVTLVGTATGGGWRVEYIRVKATALTTVGMVRLYIQWGGAGNKNLWAEIPVTAVTPGWYVDPSTGVGSYVKTWETEYMPTRPLLLKVGDKVYASTEKGETFGIFLHGTVY